MGKAYPNYIYMELCVFFFKQENFSIYSRLHNRLISGAKSLNLHQLECKNHSSSTGLVALSEANPGILSQS
jgi:hypothetical protein